MRAANRILIVEDDADLRRLFRTALSLEGFLVEEASDGIEALRIIENHPPDLVVLDLMLRVLNGASVQQELASHALTNRIPVVVVTGSRIDISGVNVECVLHKPVTTDELVRTVKRCLEKAAPHRDA